MQTILCYFQAFYAVHILFPKYHARTQHLILLILHLFDSSLTHLGKGNLKEHADLKKMSMICQLFYLHHVTLQLILL